MALALSWTWMKMTEAPQSSDRYDKDANAVEYASLQEMLQPF